MRDGQKNLTEKPTDYEGVVVDVPQPQQPRWGGISYKDSAAELEAVKQADPSQV